MRSSGRRMLWADTERGQGRPTFPTAARTESSAPPAAGELSRLTKKVQGKAYTPGCGLPGEPRGGFRPRRLSAPFPDTWGAGAAGHPRLRLPPTGAVASHRALPQHLPGLPQGSGPRPARRPQCVLPLRPARHPGRKHPCPGHSTRRRARPAQSHLRAYVRHEGRLGRLGAAATADSPFPQHPAALRSNDARRQRRRLRLRFPQRRRPPAPAAGAPPIPRAAAAAAVPPASGSAADTVRSAQATHPAYRQWDTPTAALSSQAEWSRPQPRSWPRPLPYWSECLSARPSWLDLFLCLRQSPPPGSL